MGCSEYLEDELQEQKGSVRKGEYEDQDVQSRSRT